MQAAGMKERFATDIALLVICALYCILAAKDVAQSIQVLSTICLYDMVVRQWAILDVCCIFICVLEAKQQN
jgi:hypothetical protein